MTLPSELSSVTIGVVGLGYVGLPLAAEFGKHYETIGFDIRPDRIQELEAGNDSTLELNAAELAEATRLTYTTDPERLGLCNVIIVTVPTPIDGNKRPDLSPLQAASRTIGQHLRKGTTVVYESTVYPGATEEVCIPILEELSGLSLNQDFYAGYSPERINPGDKEHRVTNIIKVTSGSTPEVAEFVDRLYGSIIRAGTHRASSIKVAEAAKVIENTQRDLNIALVNELALIFDRMNIDTLDVLEAAGTKWNFLPFRPGLVGGHCIGVDPYYLTHKAQEVGYHPEVILAGRRINDNMGKSVVERLVLLMTRNRISTVDARVLVLGLTFKENCPDLRNTRVIDVIDHCKNYGFQVDVADPWASDQEAMEEYGIQLVREPAKGVYDAIVVAVAHRQFVELGPETIAAFGKASGHVLFDLKNVLPKESVTARL